MKMLFALSLCAYIAGCGEGIPGNGHVQICYYENDQHQYGPCEVPENDPPNDPSDDPSDPGDVNNPPPTDDSDDCDFPGQGDSHNNDNGHDNNFCHKGDNNGNQNS